MSNTLIRLPNVIKRAGISRSTIYNLIKEGSFPSPIRLGGRSIAFIESEIDDWIDSKIKESRQEEGCGMREQSK